MVRSVRLTEEQERLLQEAAQARGVSISAFIRDAIVRESARTMEENLLTRNQDLFGSVHLGGGVARRTGDAFAELLSERAGKRS